MKLRYIAVILLNAVGIVGYLYEASKCWIEPSLADVPGASGGAAFVWFATAVPVVAVCVVLDWLWVVFECLSPLKTSLPALGIAVLVLPLVWAVAIYVDFAHHGM